MNIEQQIERLANDIDDVDVPAVAAEVEVDVARLELTERRVARVARRVAAELRDGFLDDVGGDPVSVALELVVERLTAQCHAARAEECDRAEVEILAAA